MGLSVTELTKIARGGLKGTYMVDNCLLLSLPSLVLIPSLTATLFIRHPRA